MQATAPRNQSHSETHSSCPPNSDSTSPQHLLPRAVSNPWVVVINGNKSRQPQLSSAGEPQTFWCATEAVFKIVIHLIPKTNTFYSHLGQRQVAMGLKAALVPAKLPSWSTFPTLWYKAQVLPPTNGFSSLWQAPVYIYVHTHMPSALKLKESKRVSTTFLQEIGLG